MNTDIPTNRFKKEGKRVYKRKDKDNDKYKVTDTVPVTDIVTDPLQEEPEIRAPDSYKTETLAEDLETVYFDSFNSFQETTCDELEQAKLASLEESWKINAACSKRWNSFQPFLQRLKQLCRYDKDIHKAYDLLSIVLYQYAYQVEVSITETEYIFIDKTVLCLRMSPEERSNLYDALNRLRFEHENN
jgi:hypothetical protein